MDEIQLISYKRYFVCTLVQWRLYIYPIVHKGSWGYLFYEIPGIMTNRKYQLGISINQSYKKFEILKDKYKKFNMNRKLYYNALFYPLLSLPLKSIVFAKQGTVRSVFKLQKGAWAEADPEGWPVSPRHPLTPQGVVKNCARFKCCEVLTKLATPWFIVHVATPWLKS